MSAIFFSVTSSMPRRKLAATAAAAAAAAEPTAAEAAAATRLAAEELRRACRAEGAAVGRAEADGVDAHAAVGRLLGRVERVGVPVLLAPSVSRTTMSGA